MAKMKPFQLVAGLAFVGAMIAIAVAQLQRARAASLTSTTTLAAESYVRTLAAMRDLYTSEVVNRLPEDVEVRHDYEGIEHAIPVPASLTIALTSRLGVAIEGLEARLFSDYPFRDRGGELDDFERTALVTLGERTDTFYVEVEGDSLLRYARADTMRAQCIECHNTHPDSPKTDWVVGDLRGVLAISLPLSSFREAAADARRPFDMLLLLAVLGVLGATVMLVRNMPTIEGREPRAQAPPGEEGQA